MTHHPNHGKIDQSCGTEEITVGMVPTLKRAFANLDNFLSVDNFWGFVLQWRDRRLHGRVPTDLRSGYLFRTAQMYGLAPGLYHPDLARPEERDLPAFKPHDIAEYLEKLIARSTDPKRTSDVKTAILVATKNLGVTVIDQAYDLHEIGQKSSELYRALMLGDFITSQKHFDPSDLDLFEFSMVKTIARQRIIWNAFDTHRTAAHGAKAASYYIAPFLKPFLKTSKHTANSVLKGLKSIGQTSRLAFSKRDTELKYNPQATKTNMRGNRGPFFSWAKILGSPIEAVLNKDQKRQLSSTEAFVRDETQRIENMVEDILLDPSRNNQETVHEFLFSGLTEVAALFVTAYRFAEEEALMMEVIAGRIPVSSVWDVGRPSLPKQINPKIAARARHIVAAFRPAILGDDDATEYWREEIRLAETSEDKAWLFLTSLANQGVPNDPNGKIAMQLATARMFDLSHAARIN